VTWGLKQKMDFFIILVPISMDFFTAIELLVVTIRPISMLKVCLLKISSFGLAMPQSPFTGQSIF
jgi:hypothetical protein